MSKWMDDKFIASKSKAVRDCIGTELKNLGAEYQKIKKISELPAFIKKVYDFVPSANKAELCLINLLDPIISYTASMSITDANAEKEYFDRIKLFCSVPDDCEYVLPFYLTLSKPKCITSFKAGNDAYDDEIVEEDDAGEEKKEKETADVKKENDTATPEQPSKEEFN